MFYSTTDVPVSSYSVTFDPVVFSTHVMGDNPESDSSSDEAELTTKGKLLNIIMMSKETTVELEISAVRTITS